MTHRMFANSVIDCILNGKKLEDEYSSREVICNMARHMYDNIKLFEDICVERSVSIESADPSTFRIRIRGLAKYYTINGKKVIISTGCNVYTICAHKDMK